MQIKRLIHSIFILYTLIEMENYDFSDSSLRYPVLGEFTDCEVRKICDYWRSIQTEDEVTETDNELPKLQLSGYAKSLRKMKKMIFLVLRKYGKTIQCIIFKKQKPIIFETLTNLPEESTVIIQGQIIKTKDPVISCDVTQYEIRIECLKVITRAKPLPFFIDDANEILVAEESQSVQGNCLAGAEFVDDTDADVIDADSERTRIKVPRKIRLENRFLDLRAKNNYNIMRIRSMLLNAIRITAMSHDFIEVSTPKLLSAASESGACVFEVNYFGRPAFLAQSPQLYKQMLINAGFKGVFEVGPVFRAEKSYTYRHLCEFIGLDFEFQVEPGCDYKIIPSNIWDILHKAFKVLEGDNKFQEIANPILEQTGVKPLIMPKEPLMIDFRKGCQMLREAGYEQSDAEDIGSVNEKHLGELVKEKYNSDIFILTDYPTCVRPFYTYIPYVISESGKRIYSEYSYSFDIIMRNNEICSGAMRNYEPDVLRERIAMAGIELDFENKTSGLEDYVRSFDYGTMPHGGGGIGVERLVMLYLGLPNVRSVSAFPRDPKTIHP